MSVIYPFYYNNPRDVIYSEYIPTITNDHLVLTVSEVKKHLNIEQCDNSSDLELQFMIKAVKAVAEALTGKTFLTTTFVTYRDCFPYIIYLKKSPVQSVLSVQYYLNNVLTTVDPATYQVTKSNIYPSIVPLPNNNWPTTYDFIKQSIVITLVVGYGDTEISVPEDIRLAMLNHIANWFANRGDCSCTCDNSLPYTSKMIYDIYTIPTLTGLAPFGFSSWNH